MSDGNGNGRTYPDIDPDDHREYRAISLEPGEVYTSAPQRLPRKTADLSAAERSRQMDETVRHLNDVTRQVNALTETCNRLQRQHAACERRLDKDEQAVAAKLNAFESSFTARLRWLLTGRW